jgi:RNA polymerase sigma factor (TIGR02999 family)
MSDVTRILHRVQEGHPTAAEELLPLVYDELRKLAAHKMAAEALEHTLQPTALVHEAWLRLVRAEDQSFQNRAHFFAAAAEAMRRILIDRARHRQAAKHGGDWERVELKEIDEPATATEPMLLRINEALEKLSQEDARASEIVKLRFFGGLSVEEVALALGITDRTARRDWRFARAWLHDELRHQSD